MFYHGSARRSQRTTAFYLKVLGEIKWKECADLLHGGRAILSAVRVRATRVAGAVSAACLGLAIGSALGLGHDHYGASPLVLVSALAAVSLGIALGRLAPEPSGVLRALTPWLGAGAVVAADRVASAELGLFGAVLLGVAWSVSARASRGPALAVVGAVGLAIGFASPLVALGIGALVQTALDLEPDSDLDRRAVHWRGVIPALSIAGGSFLVIGAWSAVRAALDPTASAFAGVGLIGGLTVTLTSAPGHGTRRWPVPLAVGVGALLVLALIAAVPHRAAVHVLPLAGVEDPRPILTLMTALVAVPGAAVVGVAARRLYQQDLAQTGGWLGLALGAFAGVHSGPDFRNQALGLACVAGLVVVLVARSWLAKAGGPLVWAAASAVILAPLPWPEEELLSSRAYQLRTTDAPETEASAASSLTTVAGGWGPTGAISIQARGERFQRAIVDGYNLAPGGRTEGAIRMAGHLGVALAAESGHAVVLGDALASATPGLIQQGVSTITVSVPDPEGLRALHALAPERTGVLLHPSVRLEAGPPTRALERADAADILVEVARTPWHDAQQGLPSRDGLRRRMDALSQGGVYVLVVPVVWMDDGDLRALFADFAEVFPDARAFRAPEGADHLLLAGWTQPGVASWNRVVQATTLGLNDLIELGVRSPLDLADRSIAGREALRALGEGKRGEEHDRLGTTLHSRPMMLLPMLLPHVEGGDWLLGTDDKTKETLNARADTTRCWLEVLDSAAEGDYPSVFEGGRCLGGRDLDPLVKPHLDAARLALQEATAEGPGSLKWRDCLAHVAAVTVLHPTSSEAWALSGRCRLVVDRTHARRDFEKALEYDAMHLDSLLGLAQIQVAQGELGAAETTLRNATKYHNLAWRPHYHLGALLMELGRYDEAEDELARAKSFAKDESSLPLAALANVYLLQDRPNDAIFWAEASVEREETARNLHILGLTWLELDQVAAAERNCRKAILVDPNYYPSHSCLGRARARQGDYLDAIDSFTRYLEFDPKNPDALDALRRARERAEREGVVSPEGQP